MYYLSDIHGIVVQLAKRCKKKDSHVAYTLMDEWQRMLSEGIQLTIDFNDKRETRQDQRAEG